LAGSLTPGSLSQFDDSILVINQNHAITARFAEDHKFSADSGDVLSPGNYLAGTVITDKQRWRQTVVTSLLDSQAWRSNAADLVLFTWVDPIPLPFDVNVTEPEQQKGNALLAVPVEIQRPSAGTEVSIPAPFITYRAVLGPSGTISPAYSNLERKWIGPLATATQANIAIELPQEVLPLELTRVTFFLNISAPRRTLRILAYDSGQEHLLGEIRGPVGTKQISIDEVDPIQFDDEGRLILVVDVGEHPNEADGNISVVGWKINDLSIQIEGIVQEDEVIDE